MSKKRVVVTGLWVWSRRLAMMWRPAGAIFSRAAAVSARIEAFDVSAYTTRFGGSIKAILISRSYLDAKEARKMDTFIQYGMAAAIQAIADSGLIVTEENAERIGAAIGSGVGGMNNIEKCHDVILNSGPRRVSPFFVPGSIINMIAGNLID